MKIASGSSLMLLALLGGCALVGLAVTFLRPLLG